MPPRSFISADQLICLLSSHRWVMREDFKIWKSFLVFIDFSRIFMNFQQFSLNLIQHFYIIIIIMKIPASQQFIQLYSNQVIMNGCFKLHEFFIYVWLKRKPLSLVLFRIPYILNSCKIVLISTNSFAICTFLIKNF